MDTYTPILLATLAQFILGALLVFTINVWGWWMQIMEATQIQRGGDGKDAKEMSHLWIAITFTCS